MTLRDFFAAHPTVALAFSGGVDSAYLLYAAKHYGAQVRAYYVRTAFQPEFEYQDALRLSASLQAELVTLPVDILSEEAVVQNPKNRCYYCKNRIFSAIWQAARADGFSVLLDGTNASDDVADRPGMQALRELEVLSPLRLCGLTKPEIRQLSREAGLFTADKPAYACLATRIPTGMRITKEQLARTEQAEVALAAMGFRDFRVRTDGNGARLQLRESQWELLRQKREAVRNALKGAYATVVLDLEVRSE